MAVPLTVASVPAQTPYIQYVSAASQTVFPYPFEITQDSDLVCLINGVAQATDSGYTLSGQGATGGGNLTFTLGQAAGTIITLYRDISIARITQLAQNGTFFSSNFNNEYNRIYLIMQQLEQSIAQCLQIPNTNNPQLTSYVLTPAAYANKYLSFDSNGNPTPALLTSSGTITGALINPLIYGQTAQELTAGYTPSSTAIPVEYDIERFGGTPGISTAAINANNAAMTAAIALVTNSGYGITLHFRGGAAYGFSGSFSIPAGMCLRGEAGTRAELVYSGSGSFLTFPSSGGRNEVENLYIWSASQVGNGITLGDASGAASRVNFRNTVLDGWNAGVVLIGTLWCSFNECELGSALGGTYTSPALSNNYGLYISMNANSFSSVTYFYGVTVSNNSLGGIYAVSNASALDFNNFAFINCNVQNNCVNATTTPQWRMGTAYAGPAGFTIQNFYSEYALGGTSPPFLDVLNHSAGTISDGVVFECGSYGIHDSVGGAANLITIRNVDLIGATTAAIYMASETDIHVYCCDVNSTSVTLTGTGCSYIPTGGGLAPTTNPTLITGVTLGAVAADTVGFYGKTPAAQTASNTSMLTSLLVTATTSTSFGTAQAAAFNAQAAALQEVINVLYAIGIYATH